MTAMIWRGFCRLVCLVFYRRVEVVGIEKLDQDGSVLLCANHANALADAVVLQAVTRRMLHPLARSGLFANPLLRPVLALIQAVPVYRRQDVSEDAGDRVGANQNSFARCYELLGRGEVLLIFPEGQSHSDPSLRAIKTGAARMALGAREANGTAPRVLPVGLNFVNKGNFRSSVLVQFGEPVSLQAYAGVEVEDDVRRLTTDIYAGLDAVTLNADSHEELDLLHSLERFFALRRGKYRRRSLALKFRAMRRLAEAQALLREHYPQRVEALKAHLQQFSRLCAHCGVRDYHLTVSYRPTVVTRFLLHCVWALMVLLPLGAWGVLNSFPPFFLTRRLARRLARGSDQYDTAKILLGMVLFPLFWGPQIALVSYYLGESLAVYYALSLIPGAAAALVLRKERERIWDNLRVFFVFVRRHKLRRYLETRRRKLEAELAELARLARRTLSQTAPACTDANVGGEDERGGKQG